MNTTRLMSAFERAFPFTLVAMRVLPFVLFATLSLPSVAQTQFADSSGGYLSLRNLGTSGGDGFFADGTVGYRFADGTDVGLRVGTLAFADGLTIGPTAGRTWAGPRLTRLRVEGAALYQSQSRFLEGNTIDGFETYDRRDLSGDITATASRSLRLLGSLRVAPTLGVFGVAEQSLSYSAPTRISRPSSTRAAAGLHFEVPLSFRLFGTTATVSATSRFALARTRDYSLFGPDLQRTYAGAGFRLNF